MTEQRKAPLNPAKMSHPFRRRKLVYFHQQAGRPGLVRTAAAGSPTNIAIPSLLTWIYPILRVSYASPNVAITTNASNQYDCSQKRLHSKRDKNQGIVANVATMIGISRSFRPANLPEGI